MTELVGYLLLFLSVGVGFIFVHLVAGKFLRPARPNTEKMTIYECGEPTIGSAWIQFDLRFYVVALLFVIFDVEVAFFFPWAVVFGKANALANPRLNAAQRVQLTQDLTPSYGPVDPRLSPESGAVIEAETAHKLAWIAFWEILVFFGFLLVGFAYLWRRGDLDWVRSTLTEQPSAETRLPVKSREPEKVLVGAVGH